MLAETCRSPATVMNRRMIMAKLLAGALMVGSGPAWSQSRRDALPLGEEPGRVSSEDVDATEEPYRRQIVDFVSKELPGTIIIHTAERHLYLITGANKAMRYGIGVGRDGFQWAGQVKISRKAEWPDWMPPAEMISRQPYLPRFMAGGPSNPMGARAMYLGSTIYRIHGTNQPETIGQSVSSGCFRLANGDVIDLFSRASVGAKVIIRQGPTPPPAQTASAQ